MNNNLTQYPALESSSIQLDRPMPGFPNPINQKDVIQARGATGYSGSGISMCSEVKYQGQTYQVVKIVDKITSPISNDPSCAVTFTNFKHQNYSNLNLNPNGKCTPA